MGGTEVGVTWADPLMASSDSRGVRGGAKGEGHANVTTARSTRGVRVTTSYSSLTPQSICLMPFTQAVISPNRNSRGRRSVRGWGASLDCKQTERQLNAKHLPGFPTGLLPQHTRLSFSFFSNLRLPKSIKRNTKRGRSGRQIKEKLCQRKLFNIFFFAWAATVLHKEAKAAQAGSRSRQWRQSQWQLDVFI